MYQAGEGRAQGSTGRSSRGVRLSGRNTSYKRGWVATGICAEGHIPNGRKPEPGGGKVERKLVLPTVFERR